jgi:phosphoheptose isomerase
VDIRCPQTGDEVLSTFFARYPDMRQCETAVRLARSTITAAFENGHKLMACGNGGSAADSEHVVGELMKSFRFKRPIPKEFRDAYRRVNGEDAPEWLEGTLPAISLVSQTALSTAFGNDEASVGIFAQQVLGYGRAGDVFLAISTSGNSNNVVEAAKVARALGVKVISLTGARESRLTPLSDVCVQVPRTEVFQVQELHLPVYHCLCAAAEADLFGEAED